MKSSGNRNLGDHPILELIKKLHSQLVSRRRVETLAQQLVHAIAPDKSASLQGLDVGCGSGEVANLITQKSLNNVQIQGVDVLVRQPSRIPVEVFDGKQLPYADRAFDFVLLVDVLHHTDDPEALLKECLRVSRKFVLIKDHLCNSRLDNWILRSMDWVGNRPYGVALTYNYLSSAAWSKLFCKLGLSEDYRQTKLHLYPFPLSLIFDANLHFLARLRC